MLPDAQIFTWHHLNKQTDKDHLHYLLSLLYQWFRFSESLFLVIPFPRSFIWIITKQSLALYILSSHWKIVQRHYLPFSFTACFSSGENYVETVCHHNNALNTPALNISTGTTSASATIPCLIILATGVPTATIDPLRLLFEHSSPYSFLTYFYWIVFHKITTVCRWLHYSSIYDILNLHRFTNPYHLGQNVTRIWLQDPRSQLCSHWSTDFLYFSIDKFRHEHSNKIKEVRIYFFSRD